jgi:hypothetical protein
MKRYLLFCGQDYYANGGWFDFRGDYDEIPSVEEVHKSMVDHDNWWHVVDTTAGKIVDWLEGHYCGSGWPENLLRDVLNEDLPPSR